MSDRNREPNWDQGVEPFDPLSTEIWSNPYPYYRMYRELDPVHRSQTADRGKRAVWYLFRHADILAARRSPSLSRGHRHRLMSQRPVPAAMAPYSEMLSHWMVEMDSPEHTRLRTLLARVFTPEKDPELPGKLSAIARRLIAAARLKGTFDFMEEVAFPLPILTMCEIIGIPSDAYGLIRRWSAALSRIENERPTMALYGDISALTLEVGGLIEEIREARRSLPREDLISRLGAAAVGGELSEAELVGTSMLLLFAGHETTANLIGNAVCTLLNHPAQLELIKSDTGAVELAVEEVLRYETPVQSVSIGHVMEPLDVGGRTIPAGERIMSVFGSANRDEECFADPDRFDILRSTARRHASFGPGLHHCPGAPLARMEARVALETTFSQMPGLRFADVSPEWREGLITRGLKSMSVTM